MSGKANVCWSALGGLAVSKGGYLLCAPVVVTTLLLSGAASAAQTHKPTFQSAAAHPVSGPIIVAQTFHAPPGVPGSTGSLNDSHAPPPVPGSTDSDGSSAGSHAPPPVPGSTSA